MFETTVDGSDRASSLNIVTGKGAIAKSLSPAQENTL